MPKHTMTIHLMDDNVALCGKRGDVAWTSDHGVVGADGKSANCTPCVAEQNRRLRYDPRLTIEEIRTVIMTLLFEERRLPEVHRDNWTPDMKARNRAWSKLTDRKYNFENSETCQAKPLVEHEIRVAALAAALELQRYEEVGRERWTSEILALESALSKLEDSLKTIEQIEKNPRADVR